MPEHELSRGRRQGLFAAQAARIARLSPRRLRPLVRRFHDRDPAGTLRRAITCTTADHKRHSETLIIVARDSLAELFREK